MISDSDPIVTLEALIDTYCAAWNEPDAGQRELLLNSVWAEDATYTDPRADTHGVEELSAHIGRVLASRPGARVIRTSVIDAHHGLGRFSWRVEQADGILLPEGLDFVEMSGEGKLQRIIGFFGPLEGLNE